MLYSQNLQDIAPRQKKRSSSPIPYSPHSIRKEGNMAEILEAVKLALKESNESIQASNKQSVGCLCLPLFFIIIPI
jgi:hypothetical protein